MTVTLHQHLCLLSPSCLIWIPALLAHQVQLSEQVKYRSVYLAADWEQPPRQHLILLLLNKLQAAHEQALFLPLPRDSRLRPLAGAKLPPALKDLSVKLGLSEKIISRLFKRDTGLNYQQWRQQWRVFKAIEQLASEQRVTWLASNLGFASDSAFIAFFKEHTGLARGHSGIHSSIGVN